MYTRCPHCTTIFRITAEQLRTAHGEIPCVTCAQPFSALDSLSDDITTLIMAPADAIPPANTIDSVADTDDDTDIAVTLHAKTQDTHTDEQIVDSADDPSDDEIQPIESMEFDAPEQSWTSFFLENDTTGPATEFDVNDDPISNIRLGDGQGNSESFEFQTGNQEEWKKFLTELKDDEPAPAIEDWSEEPIEDDPSDDACSVDEAYPADNTYPADDETGQSIIPPWLADEIPDGLSDELPEQRREFRPSWSVLGTGAALALLLAGQLIHYNRDLLAANEMYGATIQQTYAVFGAPLYPDWPLDAFEVTGTEAITGRSSPDALDILANVIVSGRQPVGLPLIRVVLHDRWASPVASRVFTPAEYLRGFDTETLLVNPGTALSVEISVADPGTEALSYVVDVCLPRRKTGLECQLAKDPFL